MTQGKKLFLDLMPLAAFFIGYRLGDLMLATALIVGATIISLTITYVLEQRIALSTLISGLLVGVFGGLTLILDDEQFIKVKPTIINCIFATVLLGGAYFYKRGLLKYVLDAAFDISDEGWMKLSIRWGFFFLFLAALNECIWRSFTTDFWVNFKVFGMLTCTILFTALQMPLIKKYTVK